MIGSEKNLEKHQLKRLPNPIRITDQSWPEGTQPLVSILCITYNHEKYIEECLRGFLIQETTFPVEIIVHDDASTDLTPEILYGYHGRFPHIFKIIAQQVNQFSKGIRPTPIALSHAKGKYIAFCEGDDYWTYKKKLEDQVSILENDINASLCFHKVKKLATQNKNICHIFPDTVQAIYQAEDIVKDNIIPTCSVLARKTAVQETPAWFSSLLMNDWPRWVMACQDGYALMIDSAMGVYRVHGAGLWSSTPWEERMLNNLDFLYRIIEHGPPQAKAAAIQRKKDLVELLTNNMLIRNRLSKHILFGPLLRFWCRYINKSFPSF